MTQFEDKISLMIPAYLRGDLSDSERIEVENASAQNPSIAAEIEFQKSLKLALKPDTNAFEPSELGWAKLSKAIDQEEAEAEQVTASQPQFWKYAAAILAVAAIGQAGVLGSIAFKADDTAQYRPVSETPVQASTAKIGFNPSVTEEQLTKTLIHQQATIISGPSSLGLYEVAFESKSACMTARKVFETQKNVIDTLSACE